MKCRMRMYLSMMLFALLTISAVAQDSQNPGPKHHHYQLIDLGTFGGPTPRAESPGRYFEHSKQKHKKAGRRI